MTIIEDCPEKSNNTLATLAEVEAAMADFPPFTKAELEVEAGLATDLSLADIGEINCFVSPALAAVAKKQERRREEIATTSAKQAREDYAIEKIARTGEPPRSYKPTGIARRHHAEGHFQFETQEEYTLRYDRERKRLRRPKFVPLTEEEKKARKKASNAKRSRR